MNILVFSWRDPKHPLAGGAEQVMHEHMKGWVKAGYGVTLFSSVVGNLKKEETLDGIKIVRGGYQYLGVQLAGFRYYQKYKDECNFVVDQFHGIPFFTPLYVKKPKLAVIQETARRVWFLNSFPAPMNWIVGALGYLLEPIIFLFYKNVHFMTGSESAKADVVKLGGIQKENITVVPHGVLLEKKKAKSRKQKDKTVVYLGILSRDKGIEDALKCFSILSKMNHYTFWVIGKPESERYFNRLKSISNDLGLSGKVKFWGFVSQQTKFELLSKAHVLVNPSVHEGWGLVNIEANVMGIPVVAYNVSGSVDSVKDGISGILCYENTPEELAKNIREILNNQKRYQDLKKGALVWSRKFSWGRAKLASLKLVDKINGL